MKHHIQLWCFFIAKKLQKTQCVIPESHTTLLD